MFRSRTGGVPERTALPRWQRAALFSLGYFFCAVVGSQLSAPDSVNVSFWLPAGLFMAVLLRNPTQEWPWLVLAVIPASVSFEWLYEPSPNPRLMLLFYLANVIRALTAAWLVRWLVAEKPRLQTLNEFLGLMIFGGIISAFLGALAGVSALTLLGMNRDFFHLFFQWWASSAVSVLVFTPFLLTWVNPVKGQRAAPLSVARVLEMVLLFGGLSLSTWYLLVWAGGVNKPKIPLLIFGLWAGLRFGVRGAAAMLLWLALWMSFLTTHYLKGLSPAEIETKDYVLTLQIYLVVAVFVGLIPPILLGERDRTLRQLRESEDRFRNLTQAAFEGIIISENSRVLDVNDQCAQQLGYGREHMIGLELLVLVAPESRSAVADAVQNQRETLLEHRLLRRDGTTFFAEVQTKVVQVGGRVLRMTALRDITERKQAEALTNSQKQVLEMIARGAPMTATLDTLLRAVEAQSPDLLASILLLDGEGVHLRHGAAPSLPKEYVDAIDGVAIGSCGGSCGTAAFRREPVLVADIASDPLWADYKSIALPHGLRACWSTPIFDAQRRVLGTFAIYQRQPGLPGARHQRLIEMATHTAAVCIAKHLADESLKRSQEALRASIENTPNVAVQWYDVQGRIVFWNHASEKMYGWSAAEAVGKTLDQLIFTAEQAAYFLGLLGKIVQTGEALGPLEFPFHQRSGVPGITLSTLFRIPIQTSELCFVCMDVDITERKKAEAERTAAVAREQQARIGYTLRLIASQEAERKRIAAELHDSLGQNLLLIKNLAQMWLREDQPEPAHDKARSIDHLAGLCLAEARQISRDLHPHQLDHLGLKTALEAMLANTVPASEIKFGWKIDPVDGIFSDEAEMNFYRIVQESLNNILKHSHAQNVRVELERDIHDVVLRITDDGVGYAADSASAGKKGMGLQNITERVRMLGGTLRMESASGQGTRIVVTVPMPASADEILLAEKKL